MLVNGLLYIAFIVFKYMPCFTDLSKTFKIMEWLIYIVYYIDGFMYIEPSHLPWNEAYLIKDLMCSWICFASILLNYFCASVHKRN